MARIAVLGDMHWGCRNDNTRIRDFQCEFFDEQFFPYLDKNPDIKEIVSTGDFFDNRKYVSMPTLAHLRKSFIDPCIERGIKVHVIAGNHDLPYRHSNKYSSVVQILGNLSNFHIYESETSNVDGVTYVPWISRANHDDIHRVLKQGGRICVGHFETTNFAMERNHICDHGTTTFSDFKPWDLVISGHFHHRSKKGNVVYVGVPYEMSFSDCHQTKGWHILDTSDLSLKLVKNKKKLFHSIEYSTDMEDFPDVSSMSECYVRLKITKNENPTKVGKLISLINSQGPHDFKIIDRSSEDYTSDNVDDIISNFSTEDIISEYIETVASDNTLKEEITKTTLEIYNMAREQQLKESR